MLDDLGQPAACGGHHRDAAGQRLSRGEAE